MSSDIQKLMQLVDDNKMNIQENDYLQMCDLLKNLYNNENDSDDEDYVVYRNDFSDIILEEKKNLLFNNVIIKLKHDDYYDDDNDITVYIEDFINNIVFKRLSTTTYEKIIERLGGEEKAHERINTYLGKDEAEKVLELQTREKQIAILAYYITDMLLFEYKYVEDYMPHNAIDARTFLDMCEELEEHLDA
jgi:hypothetical protein